MQALQGGTLPLAAERWLCDGADAGNGKGNNFSGGYNPALVRNGKVYQHYFEPTCTAPFNPKPPSKGTYTFKTTKEEIDLWKSKGANDVVVCIDGAAGRTLWRRVIPGGINQAWFTKGGGGPLGTPVVTDKHMYIFTTTATAYCLDIEKQGEVVWKQDFGGKNTRTQNETLFSGK